MDTIEIDGVVVDACPGTRQAVVRVMDNYYGTILSRNIYVLSLQDPDRVCETGIYKVLRNGWTLGQRYYDVDEFATGAAHEILEHAVGLYDHVKPYNVGAVVSSAEGSKQLVLHEKSDPQADDDISVVYTFKDFEDKLAELILEMAKAPAEVDE